MVSWVCIRIFCCFVFRSWLYVWLSDRCFGAHCMYCSVQLREGHAHVGLFSYGRLFFVLVLVRFVAYGFQRTGTVFGVHDLLIFWYY